MIKGTREQYRLAHPGTAELVIEVSVSTESLDRVKLGIYAEAGVRECWLLLAEQRLLERYSEPQGAAYQRVEQVVFPAALQSTVFPGVALPPPALFPN